MKIRCDWVGDDPTSILYHDEEWGVPLHDDRTHFEYIILDGAQAGLSWALILKKRDAYRHAFARFDPRAVAAFDAEDIEVLLSNPGIIRNRRKIESAVKNAQSFLSVQSEFGSFDRYIWRFTGGRTLQNAWKHSQEIPAETAESRAMSADLKKRGFSFVGPTICYAYMQAAGMVNDHLVDCFRYSEVGRIRR